MDENVTSWILAKGGDLQAGLFFAALAGLALLESAWPRRTGGAGRRRRWVANYGLTALNVIALGFVPVSLAGAALWAQASGIGLLHQIAVSAPVVVITTLLVRGFISTGVHWLNHRVPFLWRIHRVHHLDTELDVSSTVRFHPLEMFVGPLLGVPLVVAFGLSPFVLVCYELLDVGVTLFSHANLRVPSRLERWLHYVIVTPDLHRVHHSTWQPETDSNYGAVFPVWDLVLGTFRAHPRVPHERMSLGLEESRGPETRALGLLLLSPFRRHAGR
jgi:sterol desaturase/sphingolipid hydroxylase (fatty acid hydroxylase superfamily)